MHNTGMFEEIGASSMSMNTLALTPNLLTPVGNYDCCEPRGSMSHASACVSYGQHRLQLLDDLSYARARWFRPHWDVIQ